MTRSGVLVPLLIAGVLVLPACTSGRGAAVRGTPAPSAPASTAPPTSPAPSPTPAASVRTSVHIGPYTQVFAVPPPAGQPQARVLAQFRRAMVLWDRTNRAWHLVAPVRKYVTGSALTHLRAAMRGYRAQGLVPAGTDVFYNIRVTALTGRGATVTTCDDAARYREENARTGRTDPAYTPSAAQSFGLETWHMIPRSGHWAIRSLTVTLISNPPGTPCQL